MGQWLRLRASTAGGTGSIPGRGTKILHASRFGQKQKVYKQTYFQSFLNRICFTKYVKLRLRAKSSGNILNPFHICNLYPLSYSSANFQFHYEYVSISTLTLLPTVFYNFPGTFCDSYLGCLYTPHNIHSSYLSGQKTEFTLHIFDLRQWQKFSNTLHGTMITVYTQLKGTQ